MLSVGTSIDQSLLSQGQLHHMVDRKCSQCRTWKAHYSRTQWRKGDGSSRCRSCIVGYCCQVCDRCFDDPNSLKMHMQTHRPKSIACPLCGEQRFRSGANAVQHVEIGYCTGCLGSDNAREQIYQFASSQRAMRPHIANVQRVSYGGSDSESVVPDIPYSCPNCNRCFRQLSQLLQHQHNKHDRHPLLLQY
jgi:Zinc finger, C2H2 type